MKLVKRDSYEISQLKELKSFLTLSRPKDAQYYYQLVSDEYKLKRDRRILEINK